MKRSIETDPRQPPVRSLTVRQRGRQIDQPRREDDSRTGSQQEHAASAALRRGRDGGDRTSFGQPAGE
jgi:hypothetical protein